MLDNSLGVYARPVREPCGFAFIDIDDTIGDLSASLQALQHGDVIPTPARQNNHDYGENMWFPDSASEVKIPLYHLIRSSEAGLRPVADLPAIQRTVMSWRAAGIYTGFVTALNAGSELPAVTNFIGRYFGGNCDFVVIPDKHYTIADKGVAACDILKAVGVQPGMPVVAIDDWPTHTRKVRDAVQGLGMDLNVATFQYDFPSHMEPDGGSAHATTAIGTFDLATEFLAAQLGRTVAEQPR